MILHHLGIVVMNIERAITRYERAYQADLISPIVYDHMQKSRLCLMAATTCNLVWELIEPGPQSKTYPFLIKYGGGLHHQCFEVDNVDQSALHLRSSANAIPATTRTPAALFNGRPVQFIVLPDKTLIELLEK